KRDNPTHSANLDYPADGMSPQIRDLPLDPQKWADLYAQHGIKHDFQKKDPNNPFYESERGSVPFRVRQIFEEMVARVKSRDREGYLCAAGILAHYAGDACQPLHGTIHFNDEGCHSPYETAMLSRHRGDLIGVVKTALHGRTAPANIADGPAAAAAVMDLMK